MTKRKISRRLQRLVSERAHFCCEYCISQEAYSPALLFGLSAR